MYMYISILCARTIPGLSRSMVCARAIRGLRGQSMVCGTNHGSRVCAGQSRDCANPCFAHNRYMGRCPAKSPFWSFYFITIKIVRYTKQLIFTTVLYFLFTFRTLVHTSVLYVQTEFGALNIIHVMVIKVSNPMG